MASFSTAAGQNPWSNLITVPTEDSPSLPDLTLTTNSKFLGRLAFNAQITKCQNLDWALISLECEDFKSLSDFQTRNIQKILTPPQNTSPVEVIMPSNGATNGTISAGSVFVQLPNSVAFQEMWTVKLEKPARESKGHIQESCPLYLG